MSKGWPRLSARAALSRAAIASGGLPLATSCGHGPGAIRPSGLSLILNTTTSSCGSLAPAGGVQSCARRCRNASSSLNEICDAAPLEAPSEVALLRVSPAAASRVESRLSSSASTFLGSNLGAGGAGFLVGGGGLAAAFFGSGGGGVGVLASSFFGSGGVGLASSLASASATWSGLTSATFFSGSAGLVSGTGGGASRRALTSFFSTPFVVGSSTAFVSATFTTSGFCASTLGASLLPAVICVNSDTLTMSTGSASLGGVGSGLAANDSTLHNNTTPCPTAEMA